MICPNCKQDAFFQPEALEGRRFANGGKVWSLRPYGLGLKLRASPRGPLRSVTKFPLRSIPGPPGRPSSLRALRSRARCFTPAHLRPGNETRAGETKRRYQMDANKCSNNVIHVKTKKYDVFIGRPSKWGNPFVIGRDGNRAEVIQKYRAWVTAGNGRHLLQELHELEGRVLACYCSPLPCHGDVLAKLVVEHGSIARKGSAA